MPQRDSTDPHSKRPIHSGGNSDPSESLISKSDAVMMLRLQGTLGSLRNDPRAWRNELLLGVNKLLPAVSAAAFILKNVRANMHPTIVSMFDAGFPSDQHRNSFLHEFNTAPFRDPMALLAIQRFTTQEAESMTCLRADLVDDETWDSNLHVLTHRKPVGMGDCILSFQRGTDRSTAYALCIYRQAVAKPPEGSVPSGKALPPSRFGNRERLLIDTLHRGLEWLYAAEEAAQKLNRASGLAPRLRQTLEYLLAGDTERQIAAKMTLSTHTVHDYVKSLYIHFGVSSRNELMSKWLQTGGQLNPPEKR